MTRPTSRTLFLICVALTIGLTQVPLVRSWLGWPLVWVATLAHEADQLGQVDRLEGQLVDGRRLDLRFGEQLGDVVREPVRDGIGRPYGPPQWRRRAHPFRAYSRRW